jgi:hypothetical protein
MIAMTSHNLFTASGRRSPYLLMGIKQKHNLELDSDAEQRQWRSHTGDVSECLDMADKRLLGSSDGGLKGGLALTHLSSVLIMACFATISYTPMTPQALSWNASARCTSQEIPRVSFELPSTHHSRLTLSRHRLPVLCHSYPSVSYLHDLLQTLQYTRRICPIIMCILTI